MYHIVFDAAIKKQVNKSVNFKTKIKDLRLDLRFVTRRLRFEGKWDLRFGRMI